MADLPILFSAPMVRALLDGRKLQTRRILKDQPGDLDKPFMMDDGSWHVTDSRGGHMSPLTVRFRKGDRLYVREAWQGFNDSRGAVIAYRATCNGDTFDFAAADGSIQRVTVKKWRPGIHMPRWASRLTLTVTDVRVQRLYEISHTDAMAEGLEWVAPTWGISGIADSWQDDPRMAYRALWDAINGSGAADANPWVVALTFTVERHNIDAARAA